MPTSGDILRQQIEFQRAQQLSDMLQGRALDPLQAVSSRAPISWMQGADKLAQALVARRAARRADSAAASLGEALANQPPPEPEAYTLGPGQHRFSGKDEIASVADTPTPDRMPSDVQEYEYAKKNGYQGSYLDFVMAKKPPGTNVTVNADQKYPNAFNEALGKADVGQLEEYRKSGDAAAKLVGTLDQMEKLNPTAMSGGGAETRAKIANWLAGWTGINVADPKVLADTQQYNAVVSKSILDSLGGSLGAGVSNADVQFIRNTVPQLEYSPEARAQLIDYLRKRASEQVDLYQRAREYGEKNGGLRGFTSYPVSGQQSAPTRSLKRNPDGSLTYSP